MSDLSRLNLPPGLYAHEIGEPQDEDVRYTYCWSDGCGGARTRVYEDDLGRWRTQCCDRVLGTDEHDETWTLDETGDDRGD